MIQFSVCVEVGEDRDTWQAGIGFNLAVTVLIEMFLAFNVARLIVSKVQVGTCFSEGKSHIVLRQHVAKVSLAQFAKG